MAKGLQVGIGGVNKNMKGGYVGVGGVNKKIKQILVGVGGINKVVWVDYTPLNFYQHNESTNTTFKFNGKTGELILSKTNQGNNDVLIQGFANGEFYMKRLYFVDKYDANLTFIKGISLAYGSGYNVTAIEIDSNDDIYYAANNTKDYKYYYLKGNFTTTVVWSRQKSTSYTSKIDGAAVSPTYVYYISTDDSIVQKLSKTGTILATYSMGVSYKGRVFADNGGNCYYPYQEDWTSQLYFYKRNSSGTIVAQFVANDEYVLLRVDDGIGGDYSVYIKSGTKLIKYNSAGTKLWEITLLESTGNVRVEPNSNYVWHVTSRHIYRILKSTGEIIENIPFTGYSGFAFEIL